MKELKTIIPLSLFKKCTSEYLFKMEFEAEPIMLTLHGRGAYVIQHLNSYLQIKELAEIAVQQRSVEEMLRRMEETEYFSKNAAK